MSYRTGVRVSPVENPWTPLTLFTVGANYHSVGCHAAVRE